MNNSMASPKTRGLSEADDGWRNSNRAAFRKAGTDLEDDESISGCSGLAALIAATLIGCAVGPNYHPPETKVPTYWDGQNVVTPAQPSKTNINPVELVEWWTAFKDPTLSSLVETAVRANLDVRLAEARIRQARASLGVAGGPLWPQVDATVLYERSHSPAAAVDTAGGGVAVSGSSGGSRCRAAPRRSGNYFRPVWMPPGNWMFSGARDGTLRPPGPISRPRWRTAGTSW